MANETVADETQPLGVSVVTIASAADIVTARQRGRELAARIGFSGSDLTVIATAISELARNIIEYAKRGEISLALAAKGARSGLQIVARDRGPGIRDVAKALQDGYSTGKGLGLGLPGVRRLMDDMDVDSGPGKGTIVTARKWL
jgi:serine/threonine-protein kinase RsbT